MSYKEDDIVLCEVKNIEGTAVFVELDDKTKGSIAFSEVSAGRIRNIREFVTIGKKVVCKILRVRTDHIELSLRRVTAKEREAVLEKHKKERTLRAILLPLFNEKTDEMLEKIAKDHDLAELLDKAKENASVLEKYVTKQQMETLKKVLAEKKEKEREIKKTIMLKTQEDAGLYDIQAVLATERAEVHYLGSSKFSINVKDKEFKSANLKLQTVLDEIKERAKKKHVFFEVKE